MASGDFRLNSLCYSFPGKTLPRLKSKLSGAAGALSSLLSSVTEDRTLTSLLSQTSLVSIDNGVGQAMEEDEEESKDYVFRIMATLKPEDIRKYIECLRHSDLIGDQVWLLGDQIRFKFYSDKLFFPDL